MSLIYCLNGSYEFLMMHFGSLKLCIKYKFIDYKINNRAKFNYKIDCNLKLQSYSISFYWRLMTNLPLDYIFFLYPSQFKIFRKLNINSYVIFKQFKLEVFVVKIMYKI